MTVLDTIQFPIYRNKETGLAVEAAQVNLPTDLLAIRQTPWHEGQLRVLTYPTAQPQGWVGPEGDNFTAFSGKPVAFGNWLVKGPAGDLDVMTSGAFDAEYEILSGLASLAEVAAMITDFGPDGPSLLRIYLLAPTRTLAVERLDALFAALPQPFRNNSASLTIAGGIEKIILTQEGDGNTTAVRPLGLDDLDAFRGHEAHLILTDVTDPLPTVEQLEQLNPAFATTGGAFIRTSF